MEHLRSVQAVLWFTALALFLWLSVRKPADRRLHCVTTLIACWAVGHPFGEAASVGESFLELDPLVCQLVQHVLLASGVYSLICFFLVSAVPGTSRGAARVQAVPLALSVVVMTVAVLATPESLRVAAALVPSSNGGGPTGIAAIAFFYGTANAYLLYAFVVMIVWARRSAPGAVPGVRWGLWAITVGLSLLAAAESVFVASNVLRYFSSPAPRSVLVAAVFVLMLGIISFVCGVMTPVVVLKVLGGRIWFERLRAYRQLGPLWTLLNASFPQNRLERLPLLPWWRSVSPLHVHRRYYRRVIECRDGLVRVGPHAALLPATLPPAERLRAALRLCAGAGDAPMAPVAFALPGSDGLDADVRELVALSRAL
ncbi:MAB_1171c family putative transporter [Lentzea sp. NPDC102401]|uniref:MAB_1171c family putative transporter n=1 Tax=Lentzea sp. NPDC102401 TaxID=3364128 RepID=UPI003813E126